MSELTARGRGLATRSLAAVVPERASHAEVERLIRAHTASDLAILARWSRERPDQLAVLELDEDRRTVRALVRGLAGGVGAERRRLATVPTRRLSDRVIERLVNVTSLGDLADQLGDHPLAPALAGRDTAAIDLIAIETALAQAYSTHTRSHATDPALRTYRSQVIDSENAAAAILLAARGRGLSAPTLFIEGGERLSATAFIAAARAPLATAREQLSVVFAGTPLASAVLSTSPSALETAMLAWQLAAQRRLRRTDPHGLASVIHVILRRREEARELRRASWQRALGGGQ